MDLHFGNYFLTDDKSSVDIDRVVALLNKTYWAQKRDRAIIEKSIENSLCFCLFHDKDLIGFGRALSDGCLYALLLDIVIDEQYRQKGLGKKLVEFMTAHPKLSDASQVLWTKDAQSFYAPFGFREEGHFSVMFKRPNNNNFYKPSEA